MIMTKSDPIRSVYIPNNMHTQVKFTGNVVWPREPNLYADANSEENDTSVDWSVRSLSDLGTGGTLTSISPSRTCTTIAMDGLGKMDKNNQKVKKITK